MGKPATVYYSESNTGMIEGRKVKAKPVWCVKWRDSIDAEHVQHFEKDGIIWRPIREVTDLEREETVYNIGVKDDESYVAEGIIVHNCKHFSKAKGAALVDRNIRGLAWIVLRWAARVRPRVIILENVEEFQTWGPVRRGRPIKSKAGVTFARWLGQLRDLGYEVEFRELVAADYGAPTIRKRFVLVARCDGIPIKWPEPTHSKDGAGGLRKWVSAAEIIDWNQPCYSIFATKEEIKTAYGVNAVRPLAKNTLRRIIRGVDKFTIQSGKPFIVECNHSGMGHTASAGTPISTITRKCTTGLCDPVLSPVTFSNTSGSVGFSGDKPTHTITTDGKQVLASAQLMSIGQLGGSDRKRGLREPVPTIVSKAECCLTTAQLIQYHTEQTDYARAQGLDTALSTVDASNRYGLSAVNLVEYYGNGNPIDLEEPMHTITGRDREALAALHICKYYGGVIGAEASEPIPTVTSIDHNAIVASHLAEFKGKDKGQGLNEPLRTITASAGEFGECRTVLAKVDGRNLQRWPQIRELLNQFCGYKLTDDEVLLLVINGTAYYIADILLRMLTPKELYRATGFPPDYIIDRDYTGKPYPKSAQVARCGNAVCPPMAEAVVRANYEASSVYIKNMEQLAQIVSSRVG